MKASHTDGYRFDISKIWVWKLFRKASVRQVQRVLGKAREDISRKPRACGDDCRCAPNQPPIPNFLVPSKNRILFGKGSPILPIEYKFLTLMDRRKHHRFLFGIEHVHEVRSLLSKNSPQARKDLPCIWIVKKPIGLLGMFERPIRWGVWNRHLCIPSESP